MPLQGSGILVRCSVDCVNERRIPAMQGLIFVYAWNLQRRVSIMG
jgi:hypothetical protein